MGLRSVLGETRARVDVLLVLLAGRVLGERVVSLVWIVVGGRTSEFFVAYRSIFCVGIVIGR